MNQRLLLMAGIGLIVVILGVVGAYFGLPMLQTSPDVSVLNTTVATTVATVIPTLVMTATPTASPLPTATIVPSPSHFHQHPLP